MSLHRMRSWMSSTDRASRFKTMEHKVQGDSIEIRVSNSWWMLSLRSKARELFWNPKPMEHAWTWSIRVETGITEHLKDHVDSIATNFWRNENHKLLHVETRSHVTKNGHNRLRTISKSVFEDKNDNRNPLRKRTYAGAYFQRVSYPSYE